MRNRIPWSGLASVFFVASPLALGGDLNPPAGPITATGRFGPRIEINQANTPGDADSLFRISAPGSYYVGGNITGVNAKHGIEIGASGVTLDLMGFELRGVDPRAGVSLSGIRTDGAHDDLTVRNGTVTGWGGAGIDLVDDGFGTDSLIESVHASHNAGIGMRSNVNSVIRACSAMSNGSTGIIGFSNSVVESCAAQANGNHGIGGGQGAVVRGCLARDNVVNGISVSFGSTVVDCSGSSNDGDGIRAGNGSTVSHCTAALNKGDGIEVTNDCLVLTNTCYLNGNAGGDAAGVHATGSDNRIDGNNVTDSDRGIEVDAAGNFIVRNTASGNTSNYIIAGGNTIGSIFDFSAGGPITSAVVGGTGFWPGPWANFQF